jgi:hypothetical protein
MMLQERTKEPSDTSSDANSCVIIPDHDRDDEFLNRWFWEPIENTLEDFQQANKIFSMTKNDRSTNIKRDPKTLARRYKIVSLDTIDLTIIPHNISLKDLKNKMKFYVKMEVRCSDGNGLKSTRLYTEDANDAMNSFFRQIDTGYNEARFFSY